MKLTQVLSQAHATAGYNRNKFLVFALLCTNCFTLVTLYGTVPRFSGTLDIDDAADVDLRSSSGGEGRGGESAWGEEGGGALGTGQGGTSALRLSNATDRTFKRGFGMQVSLLEPGMGPGKGGRREGGQLGWGRLKSRGQGKTPALRLSNATDRTLKRGFGMQASMWLCVFQRVPPLCKPLSLRFTCIAPIPFPMRACQGFVYFSAYRLSASLFVVIGLSPLPLHRNLDARVCRWYPATSSSSPILGEVSIEYPGESHSKPYEVAMLFCQLSSPTPSTRERGRKGDGRRSEGGHLTVVIEREEILVLGEPANEKLPLEPSAPYASNITYCSSPIYGQFNSLRVLEWVVYHQRGHGVDLFHMYDAGGMGEPIMRTLGPFIKAGQMTVTDVTEVDEFETWFGQVLVVNDCAYRSLFTSRWVLFLDLDEYLYVSQPLGSSLITALTRYEVSQCASYQLARSLFTSRWVLFLALDEYLYVSQPLGSSLITALARYEVTPISSLRIFASCSRCALFLDFDEYLYASQPLGSSLITALNRYEVSLMCVHLAFAITSRRVLFLGFDEYLYVSQPFGSSLITALSRYDSSTSMVLLSSLHSLAVLPLTLTARSCWVLFPDFDEYLFVSQPLGSYLITALTLYEEAAYVSFGSLYFYTDKCSHSMNVSASSPPRWEVERMIFRQADCFFKEKIWRSPSGLSAAAAQSLQTCTVWRPKRYESRDMCLGFDGHRKYIADPRKVKLFGKGCLSGREVWGVCIYEGGRWEVERMIFRQADVHCVAPKRYESRNLCLGFDGHRKYIVDLRRVKLFGVSQQGLLWGSLGGRRLRTGDYFARPTSHCVALKCYEPETCAWISMGIASTWG
ncbi:unnamed protein product [Closterium sp. NIES-64]|nr:unnamed protein product [Closterium sp. NIES-64]